MSGAPVGDDRAGQAMFARAWAASVAATSYLPMTREELETLLRELTGEIVAAIVAEPFDSARGYRIGSTLVAAHLVSAEALGRTVEVVNLRLLRDAGLTGPEAHARLARLLGTVVTGYARARRERTLDEQDAIRRAAMVARESAETALRESEARFRYLATHDSLTGLPNRVLFTERLASVFATAGDDDRRVGICFVDLDGFKMVNDALGHHHGDQLLVAIADRLRHRLTRHLVARMGGDEFVILVEDTTGTDDVVAVADAALAAVTGPVRIDGHELTVSASIGVVESRVAETDPDGLMRAADVTLHWAKASGKGQWALFDATRNEHQLARYALHATMPAALERGEFFLDYQPMVSLTDGRLRGVEALVRWRHPELGVLNPDRFIDIAEETGLIIRLGNQVLRDACAQARAWREVAVSPPFVSVNLAMRQVQDPGLVGYVRGVLGHTGLPAHLLQLEITESAVMGNAGHPVTTLRALADLGVRIAVDDFGTGYSNLTYLRRLPLSELKIAGEFVAGLRLPPASAPDPARDTDESILAMLISLAHLLGLTVTAEGVETPAQAHLLRRLGCDAAQGWHFGGAATPDHITSLLVPPATPA